MRSFSVVVPARYGSSRFPGKPLVDLGGRSMIRRVVEQAEKSAAVAVIVATDDERIEAEVRGFGGQVVMTAASHDTGTDRIHEAVSRLDLPADAVVVNVQGDEPLIPPEAINQVASLVGDGFEMATLCEPIEQAEDLFNPNVVKVVTDQKGCALYFSRAPIPWDRDRFPVAQTALERGRWCRHLGIYAYTTAMLARFVGWAPAGLEQLEKLEQLRVLANGGRIRVESTRARIPPGVDVPEDVARILEQIAEEQTP